MLSECLGWGLVPETVERPEGPFGPGSVQRFVHEDGTSHYFTLRDEPKWHPALMRLCAFDVVANNADRKSGHVLLAEDRLWAIDNGLCFNEHDKLRTVIWDFGGAPLEAAVQEDLARLAHDGPPAALCELIEPTEVAATLDRVAWLLSLRALPELVDDGDWPPVPLAARLSRGHERRRTDPVASWRRPLRECGSRASAARRSPAGPRPGPRPASGGCRRASGR